MQLMFVQAFRTGLFFVPLLGGEGPGFCATAWVIVLGCAMLQYRLASRGKWKWVCPAAAAAVLCLTEILLHVIGDMGTAMQLMISYIYQLYVLTGALAGWVGYGLLHWMKKK